MAKNEELFDFHCKNIKGKGINFVRISRSEALSGGVLFVLRHFEA